MEIAVRSTRNALRRHAESVRDDESKLGCRSVLGGIVGATGESASPAETLGLVEQVGHVLETTHRAGDQLPVALRAAVAFVGESPRRARDCAEMLRLVLRHGYVLAADHLPRQLRDDGTFRASALADVLRETASEYLSDELYQQHAAGS